jgi:DNA-binding response OmpR family regulator
MKTRQIVLIEDDKVMAELIELTLKRYNLSVYTVNRPADALKVIQRIKPEMVILEVFLPGWNGLDLLRSLKEGGFLESMRVIVLSSLGFREVVQQAVVLGATDFLVKPFDMDVLAEKITRWTQNTTN